AVASTVYGNARCGGSTSRICASAGPAPASSATSAAAKTPAPNRRPKVNRALIVRRPIVRSTRGTPPSRRVPAPRAPPAARSSSSLDRSLDGRVAARGRLDQQQALTRAVDRALPPIGGQHAVDSVHAGGEPPLDEKLREPLGLLGAAARRHDQPSVRAHRRFPPLDRPG